MERKQEILDLLLPTLRATRNLSDLKSLEYDTQREVVVARFESGAAKVANIAGDSGTAMIKDILNQIV